MRRPSQKMTMDENARLCASSDDGHNSRSASARSTKPLKGRKKFSADLAELSTHIKSIPNVGQWAVKSVKPGDEEASLEVVLANASEDKEQTIILVVSDSSEYPDEHTYFGYSQDAGALEPRVARVIDKLPTKTGCTLREIVGFFVETMPYDGDDEEQTEEDDDDESDVMMYDDDFDELGHLNSSETPLLSFSRLAKDFLGVQAAGYNPGILWTHSNRFILSVSVPVTDLFKHVLPHALLAWDRHFLEPGQNLTLLISGFADVYPVLQQDGTLSPNHLRGGTTLKFKVGFTQSYKPSMDNATHAFREFFLKSTETNAKEDNVDDTTSGSEMDLEREPDPGAFRRMSLSTPLESLLDQQLLRLLQLRRKFNLGWAAAEELLWQTEITQEDSSTIFPQKKKEMEKAESDERLLSESNVLPSDPVDNDGSELNLLKIAFVFLLRRLALSTRHCVVCHKKLGTYDALRPYVCSSGLCVFQYYSLNLGPSIEREIVVNTGAVDLLVSLAYVAAVEDALDEPLPRGMGLQVRPPTNTKVDVDEDGLCEFDALTLPQMRVTIASLLSTLPPIKEMKEYLQRQFAAGNMKARVNNMDPEILPAAWSILRWCAASCTSHIQELTEPDDRLSNTEMKRTALGVYRQFRFVVGSPDKEKKFLGALPQGDNPVVFAFHGSPLKNWHSIIRHGLWFKGVTHGRSHGHGVYFCQDASVSLSGYARPSSTVWGNSAIKPTSCCTLAELVNRRKEFVYNGPPYFVVDKTDWIMCRYLLVQALPTPGERLPSTTDYLQRIGSQSNESHANERGGGIYLKQEPNLCTTMSGTKIQVPQPSYQVDKLVKACVSARREIVLEDEDRAIFDGPKEDPSGSVANLTSSSNMDVVTDTLDQDMEPVGSGTPGSSSDTADKESVQPRPLVVWTPDDNWIGKNAKELLPPPTESSVTASVALKREFRAMMREQKLATDRGDLGSLGWYLPPQHNQDNLYQWLVELHSFDPELPIAKDMTLKGIPSITMEIRFPPSFPHAPPFFRVIRPRFRPFAQGGGGHVTIGGSICMDLLTSDGWLPSYCVSAVLMQIKLAMESTAPFPARLQQDWDRAYTPDEALKGYMRAANFHNWKIKNTQEIQRLVTST